MNINYLKKFHCAVDSTNNIIELLYISTTLQEYDSNAVLVNKKYPENKYDIINYYMIIKYPKDKERKFIVTNLVILPKKNEK